MKKTYLFIRLVLILNILLYNVFNISIYSKNKTKIIIDHAGNKVRIPINPKRIASLHTMSTSVMLVDLKAPIIGTATRLQKKTGRYYIRGVEELFGIKFENTNYYNYGPFGEDIEQIKLSKPDLIVGTEDHGEMYEQLKKIAPVLLIRFDKKNIYEIYKDLAKWIGYSHIFKKKEKLYKRKLKKIKNKLSTNLNKKTYVYMHASEGESLLRIWKSYGALGKVLKDFGMKVSSFIKNQFDSNEKNGAKSLSIEIIGKLNADYIFTTYRVQHGHTKETQGKILDKISPGWRNFLKAVRNGRFISLNRSQTFPTSFKTYNIILDNLLKYIK